MPKPIVKIGVLADTHVKNLSGIPDALIKDLTKMDLIVHLGDFHSPELVRELKELSNFVGVTGNHDRKVKSLLPEKEILEINGKRFGLTHGHGCFLPFGLKNGLTDVFAKDKVDAILYGHTHLVNNNVEDDVLFFNPGSAVGRFPAAHHSYGVLTVGEDITGTIHYFSPQESGCTLHKGTESCHKVRHLALLHQQKWCRALKSSLLPLYCSLIGK